MRSFLISGEEPLPSRLFLIDCIGVEPERSERDGRPFAAIATDLEDPAADIEIISPVWRCLIGGGDSKDCLHCGSRRSASHFAGEFHGALARKIATTQSGRQEIYFRRFSLAHLFYGLLVTASSDTAIKPNSDFMRQA